MFSGTLNMKLLGTKISQMIRLNLFKSLAHSLSLHSFFLMLFVLCISLRLNLFSLFLMPYLCMILNNKIFINWFRLINTSPCVWSHLTNIWELVVGLENMVIRKVGNEENIFFCLILSLRVILFVIDLEDS